MPLFDDSQYVETPNLKARFIQPPFSVIDTRQGDWQTRQREWNRLIPVGDIGREHIKTITWQAGNRSMTSMFDPALAELCLTWWAPPAAHIYDPYAGGPVRGLISAALGHHYHGGDISAAQIATNYEVTEQQRNDYPGTVKWEVADAATPYTGPRHADYVLTCPPYGDLEVYDPGNPQDASTMTRHEFENHTIAMAAATVNRMKPDTFATVVCGQYRQHNKLQDMNGIVTEAFEAAGATLYSDAVLINMYGTAPQRASAHFNHNRKPVRIHQTVLTFAYGDGMAAAHKCEIGNPL